MDRLDQMHLFTRVAELCSFTQAADSLGLPKASVSEAVKQLEAHLGTRLFNRTTRRVSLTPDGQVFYERSRDLLADMDEATTMFRQSDHQLTGRIRVDMPSGPARNAVIPRLPEFLNEHPDLDIELSSTDRRVDLIREGFDCVIRIGHLDSSSLIARRLGALRMVNCASPTYVQQFGVPNTLEDLKSHRLVHYVQSLGGKSAGWEYLDGMEARTIDVPGSVTVNNADAYTQACLAGLGLIQVPWVGVRDSLANGRLVEVMPEFPAEPMPVSLLYPHRRSMARRVRVFIEWLANLMKEYTEERLG